MLPIQPDRAKEILQRRMGLDLRCGKFVATNTWLKAIISTKVLQAMYWVKGLNICLNVIFQFLTQVSLETVNLKRMSIVTARAVPETLVAQSDIQLAPTHLLTHFLKFCNF